MLEDDAYSRMKLVLRWYLSGFYKKPKVRSAGATPQAQGHPLPHTALKGPDHPHRGPQVLRDGAWGSDFPPRDPLGRPEGPELDPSTPQRNSCFTQ